MRLVFFIVLLIALFALLARALPPVYYLPLYCLFLIGGIGFAFWERRRLQLRQARLEKQYRAQQVDWQAITWKAEEEE